MFRQESKGRREEDLNASHKIDTSSVRTDSTCKNSKERRATEGDQVLAAKPLHSSHKNRIQGTPALVPREKKRKLVGRPRAPCRLQHKKAIRTIMPPLPEPPLNCSPVTEKSESTARDDRLTRFLLLSASSWHRPQDKSATLAKGAKRA